MSEKVDKQNVSQDLKKLRFTLSSPSAQRIERVCDEILARCRQLQYDPRGPVRLPTKVLSITTRKTPNGEGSKTWDTYEMRIHKRIILVRSLPSDVLQITSSRIDPKVNLTVTFAN
ncbi:ribosomal 40S subunit protein S20 [Starmerella bacillaris]|uniref:Ribosomal 40S subunit protein S20 n=1 Tax=Starmerella bacillaris TaxID=1247836 RepID=A0AAV5RGF8_STABA|nr:ribosomal 40S subunit protein S20 [Starmerella bacillaris]